MKNPKILAILTVIFWSFSSALARLLTFSSPYLLFCFSFAFALVIYLIYAKRIYRQTFWQKLRCIPPKYFLMGILGYYAIWLGNTESFLAYDSASETTVLNYTWLIFTVFFSQLIFNRPKKISGNLIVGNVGVLFCFLSVYVLAVEGRVTTFDFTNIKGLLWGLIGGMAYGLFSAYSSKVPEEDHPLFLIAAVSSSLLAMIITFLVTVESMKQALIQISFLDVFYAFALGVLVDAFGYIMWTRSLQEAVKTGINISKIASIIFLLPLLSLVIVAIAFSEDTIFRQYFLFSILLLLIGMAFSQKAERISSYLKQIR
ncbi:MAG: DMT family transporter [Bacteroidales bacterium]|nr:DMT family transporter [Bacteroidales bacterium]MCF8388108.1 DMT family transporter [Bacteroidales bacterium]MCF8398710.1 DMT family transporter [Bacteroidales bacterium]